MSVSEAWVHGVAVEWARVFEGARRVDVPTYPFQRRRYWLDAPPPGRRGTGTDDWLYRVAWRPASEPAQPPALAGTWLLLTPSGAVENDAMAAVADGLKGAGADVVVAAAGEAGPPGSQVAGVVSLLALADAGDPLPATAALPGALARAGIAAPLWVLTRQAVTTGTADAPPDPWQARLWGLGRVAALEHPERWGGLVDLPGQADQAAVARLAAVLAGAAGQEDQLAVHATGLAVRRLTRAPAAAAAGTWHPGEGTVLVTGGTGALGAHVARWLARRGAAHLLLLSRRGDGAPGAAVLAEELRGLGAGVTVAACDAGDRDALARTLADVPEDRPLTAVFHTAGVLDDGALDDLTPERFAAVARPKSDAALHLHELTAGLDLSAFVLFSSFAGAVGNVGQANYAAANAFLDALAERRRAEGLPATSLAWGAWAEAGLATGEVGERLRQRGVAPMDPQRAVAAMHTALDGDETAVGVAAIEWGTFAQALRAVRPAPLLDELPEAAPAADDGAPGQGLAERLAGHDAEERQEIVSGLVRGHVAAVLRHAAPDSVDGGRAFRDLGFDSLTAVDLRNRLGAATGLRLPTTLAFDHPTIDDLTAHLLAELAPADTGPAEGAAELRRLLDRIPFTRLKESGLYEALRNLAEEPAPERPAEPAGTAQERELEDEEIDGMSVADLVQLVLSDDGDSSNGSNHTSGTDDTDDTAYGKTGDQQ
ncbi:Erythronolide synthase, modules 1 and 2 [Streptomyces sp. MP131-18]|nr:Erythronolide synthase, modules 1 and 2 [Streptomyces sp. MP131-18]